MEEQRDEADRVGRKSGWRAGGERQTASTMSSSDVKSELTPMKAYQILNARYLHGYAFFLFFSLA